MQQVITERLTEIEKKVKQLAKKMEQLQKNNLALEEENRKLKSGLAVYKQQANQPPNLGVATTTTTPVSVRNDKSGADKRSKKMKKEIEQYLKEIDKCIMWLQNN